MTLPDTTVEVAPSLAVASPQELASLDESLIREREWYSDAPRFLIDDDIQDAVADGALVEFHDSPHARRIGRFSAEMPGFAPYLSPRAWDALQDFSELWREVLHIEMGVVAPLDRLAVTSMVRTQEYQDQLVADSSRLASPDSTHCVGEAFDIDTSGYYIVSNNGRLYSSTDPRRREAQMRVTAQLRSRLGAPAQETAISTHPFDKRIGAAAILAARQMHAAGSINLVEEFSGTENACLHIAVNPSY